MQKPHLDDVSVEKIAKWPDPERQLVIETFLGISSSNLRVFSGYPKVLKRPCGGQVQASFFSRRCLDYPPKSPRLVTIW